MFIKLYKPLILGCALTSALSANAKQPTQKKELPILNRWFAYGSGCKASSEKPGDVTLALTEKNNIHTAEFSLKNFALSPAAANQANPKGIASECTIRININPPPNKKIKMMSLKTALQGSKTPNQKLVLYANLKLGAGSLGQEVFQFDTEEGFKNRQLDVMIMPGKSPETAMPSLGCGGAKIIGIDYTFMGRAEDSNFLGIDARVANDGAAKIVVDHEDCKT